MPVKAQTRLAEKTRPRRKKESQRDSHANDFSVYKEINHIVQQEPYSALDPEKLCYLALKRIPPPFG